MSGVGGRIEVLLPSLANELVCRRITGASCRPETPRSEAKDFIAHNNGGGQKIHIFSCRFLEPRVPTGQCEEGRVAPASTVGYAQGERP